MRLISKQEAEGHCVNSARCFKMADWVICAGCERRITESEKKLQKVHFPACKYGHYALIRMGNGAMLHWKGI